MIYYKYQQFFCMERQDSDHVHSHTIFDAAGVNYICYYLCHWVSLRCMKTDEQVWLKGDKI